MVFELLNRGARKCKQKVFLLFNTATQKLAQLQDRFENHLNTLSAALHYPFKLARVVNLKLVFTD